MIQVELEKVQNECAKKSEDIRLRESELSRATAEVEKYAKAIVDFEKKNKDMLAEISSKSVQESKLRAEVAHSEKRQLFWERNAMDIEDNRITMLMYLRDQQTAVNGEQWPLKRLFGC